MSEYSEEKQSFTPNPTVAATLARLAKILALPKAGFEREHALFRQEIHALQARDAGRRMDDFEEEKFDPSPSGEVAPFVICGLSCGIMGFLHHRAALFFRRKLPLIA
jgi:hypothetical protein